MIEDLPDPETPAAIYYLTGDDAADDPAYGMEPVMVGTFAEAQDWLEAQPPHLVQRYSVMCGTRVIAGTTVLGAGLI